MYAEGHQERGCSLADAGRDTSRIPSTQTVCRFLRDLKENLEEGDASALRMILAASAQARAQTPPLGLQANAMGT
jgi:hypothetical protein